MPGAVTWVGIHQPCYFPWLGFFDKLASADRFIFLDHVEASQPSWINRVNIRGGKAPILLTVPVHVSLGDRTTVRDTRIADSRNWRTKHLRSLAQTYARAAFRDEVLALVEPVLSAGHEFLIDLNLAFLDRASRMLGLEVAPVFSSGLGVEHLSSNEMLIELCRAAGGSGYLSGRGSSEYLDAGPFRDAGIALAYQGAPRACLQRAGAPLPEIGLSILDDLFHQGPAMVMASLRTARWGIEPVDDEGHPPGAAAAGGGA